MKAMSSKQEESEVSGQKDPSFWRLIEKAKAGVESADELRRHPKVVKMILVICISLMRSKNAWEYKDIEALQAEIGLRIRREISSFAGETESDFGNWLWRVARRQLNDRGRDVKKEMLIAWWGGLSDREKQILSLHASGHDLGEISKSLPGRGSQTQLRRELVNALKRLELVTYRWQDGGLTQTTRKGKSWKRKVKKKAQTPP